MVISLIYQTTKTGTGYPNTKVMKLKMIDYRCTKEEFESMSSLEKRNYISQIGQEETNWWLLTMAKINVIGFFIALAVCVIAILSNIK
jgi:hypothetical protein